MASWLMLVLVSQQASPQSHRQLHVLYQVVRIRFALMQIRIRLITLMRILIRHFHPNADPDPDPSFQIKAQTLNKSAQICSYSYIFA